MKQLRKRMYRKEFLIASFIDKFLLVLFVFQRKLNFLFTYCQSKLQNKICLDYDKSCFLFVKYVAIYAPTIEIWKQASIQKKQNKRFSNISIKLIKLKCVSSKILSTFCLTKNPGKNPGWPSLKSILNKSNSSKKMVAR